MRALLASAPLLSALALCNPALADSHGVTIVNNGPETIHRIEIGTPDNRLRSQLPPGAQARIAYSTGCQADVRLGYDSGRTEAFSSVDVCSDPRIVTGQGVTAATTPSTQARTASKSDSTIASTPVSTSPPSTTPVKAPPPVVPPWTGKSITKRFGGMD